MFRYSQEVRRLHFRNTRADPPGGETGPDLTSLKQEGDSASAMVANEV
jgi:hypothetical protein